MRHDTLEKSFHIHPSLLSVRNGVRFADIQDIACIARLVILRAGSGVRRRMP